jgi:hypothetical protein
VEAKLFLFGSGSVEPLIRIAAPAPAKDLTKSVINKKEPEQRFVVPAPGGNLILALALGSTKLVL